MAAGDVELILALEVHGGNYPVQGQAARYAHLGVTRDHVRDVLHAVVPEYAPNEAARGGTGRRGTGRAG